MSSRKPAHSPSRRTATRRLSCLVISSSASNTKSSASTAGWAATRARSRSVRVTMPSRRPCSATRTRRMPCCSIRWAMWLAVASGATVTTRSVITSRAVAPWLRA